MIETVNFHVSLSSFFLKLRPILGVISLQFVKNATTYKFFKVSLIKKQRLKWGFLMSICSLDPLEQFQPEWIHSETDEKETYTLFDRQN